MTAHVGLKIAYNVKATWYLVRSHSILQGLLYLDWVIEYIFQLERYSSNYVIVTKLYFALFQHLLDFEYYLT